jgi:hypothetical protein
MMGSRRIDEALCNWQAADDQFLQLRQMPDILVESAMANGSRV